MGDKNLKEIEDIEKEVEEQEHDYVEKFATISDDKKSLLIRIPQEIRRHFKITTDDKIRFYAEFRARKTPELKISLERKNVR